MNRARCLEFGIGSCVIAVIAGIIILAVQATPSCDSSSEPEEFKYYWHVVTTGQSTQELQRQFDVLASYGWRYHDYKAIGSDEHEDTKVRFVTFWRCMTEELAEEELQDIYMDLTLKPGSKKLW